MFLMSGFFLYQTFALVLGNASVLSRKLLDFASRHGVVLHRFCEEPLHLHAFDLRLPHHRLVVAIVGMAEPAPALLELVASADAVQEARDLPDVHPALGCRALALRLRPRHAICRWRRRPRLIRVLQGIEIVLHHEAVVGAQGGDADMAAVPLLHHTCIAALGVPTRFRNKAFARTRGANDPSARHLGSISESLIATSLLFKKKHCIPGHWQAEALRNLQTHRRACQRGALQVSTTGQVRASPGKSGQDWASPRNPKHMLGGCRPRYPRLHHSCRTDRRVTPTLMDASTVKLHFVTPRCVFMPLVTICHNLVCRTACPACFM